MDEGDEMLVRHGTTMTNNYPPPRSMTQASLEQGYIPTIINRPSKTNLCRPSSAALFKSNNESAQNSQQRVKRNHMQNSLPDALNFVPGSALKKDSHGRNRRNSAVAS